MVERVRAVVYSEREIERGLPAHLRSRYLALAVAGPLLIWFALAGDLLGDGGGADADGDGPLVVASAVAHEAVFPALCRSPRSSAGPPSRWSIQPGQRAGRLQIRSTCGAARATADG